MFQNKKLKKTVLVLSIAVFLVINAISVVLALNKVSISNPPKSVVKVSISSSQKDETIDYFEGELVNIPSGNAQIEFNGGRIFITTPAQFKISNQNVEIKKGIALIQPSSFLQLQINEPININVDETYIYDSTNQTIIVLDGSISIKDKDVEKNMLASWKVDNFITSKFNRSDLTQIEEYKNLRIVLNDFNIEIASFNDVVAPKIENLFPENFEIIQNKFITITGKTEKDAKITVDKKPVSMDKLGNFEIDIVLSEGENILDLEAEDINGNVSTIKLNYTYNPDILPLSFPQ
jgi:hypothetical protein